MPTERPGRHRHDPPAATAVDDRAPEVARGVAALDRLAEPQPERGPVDYARRTRMVVYLVVAALVLVLSAVGGISVFVLGQAAETDRNSADIDQVEAIATGEVEINRAGAVTRLRGVPGQVCDDPADTSTITLECANQALTAAGLAPVPDPGPDVAPSQLGAIVGEARATLRIVVELEARGTPLPGVDVPDAVSGRFRR